MKTNEHSSNLDPHEAETTIGSPESGAATRRPVTSAALHAEAKLLSFRPTRRDHAGAALGVLVDASGVRRDLALTAEGAWSLTAAPLLPGSSIRRDPPVLLYESAANVLRGGAVNLDGTISYAGGDYLLQPSSDGPLKTAKVASA